jgi:site-specific recombinase XerD
MDGYEDEPHTLRSYRKELERLVLWSALVVRKPVSSLLGEDCLAYRTFLAATDPRFCGPRAPRGTERWRPFVDEPMKPVSQRQAVIILRAAFDWLVKVRYLGGNPWTTVKDPKVAKRRHGMKIERALPKDTWNTLVALLQQRAEVAENRQDRLALAALLLLGDSGLRREEAVTAQRENLEPSCYGHDVWLLSVVGKGHRERLVPVSPRTVQALRAHWIDRDMAFDHPAKLGFLLAPVSTPKSMLPSIPVQPAQHCFHVNSLYHVVAAALRRVCADGLALGLEGAPTLSPEEVVRLAGSSPHAFRHTYATLAVENAMPIEVVQEILGHASVSTTNVYVRARDKRISDEGARYYRSAQAGASTAKDLPPGPDTSSKTPTSALWPEP